MVPSVVKIAASLGNGCLVSLCKLSWLARHEPFVCCKHKKSSCSPLLDIGERRGISGKFPSENKIPRITPQVFTIEFEIVFPSQGGRRCRQTDWDFSWSVRLQVTRSRLSTELCRASPRSAMSFSWKLFLIRLNASLSLSLSPSLLELNDRKPGSYIDSLEFSYYGYPVLVPSRLVWKKSQVFTSPS